MPSSGVRRSAVRIPGTSGSPPTIGSSCARSRRSRRVPCASSPVVRTGRSAQVCRSGRDRRQRGRSAASRPGRTATLSHRSPVARRTANVIANGDVRLDFSAPGASYVSSVTLPRDSNPTLSAGLDAERDDEGHVDRSRTGSARSRLRPARRSASLEPSLHLREPIAVVDGGQEVGSDRRSAWFSTSRFSARSSGSAGRRRRRSLWSQSVTSWLDGDRRERRRIDLVRDVVQDLAPCRAPRAREPACRRPRCRPRRRGRRAPISATRAPPRRSPTPASPPVASRVAKPTEIVGAERGSGRTRSRIGRAAHRRPRDRRAARPSCRTRSVCGAISSVLATATSSAEHDPPDPPCRHGLRVGDHEEQEDQDLGRGHDHPPEVEAADRRERPVRRSCSGPTRRGSRRRPRGPTQKVAARASRRSRRVISSPPPMITA